MIVGGGGVRASSGIGDPDLRGVVYFEYASMIVVTQVKQVWGWK